MKENNQNSYIGIDIGGMTIKGVAVDDNGNILTEKAIPTEAEKGAERLCESIVSFARYLIDDIQTYNHVGIGIGSPGIVDSQNGVVVFAGNLNLRNYPLAKNVSQIIGLPVKMTNDANAAALGEAKFGAGKNYNDSILVTLGTGVGGGIVIDGKLFEGNKSAGAEIGHMIIERNGRYCTCGNKGCFEAYSSANALKQKTAEEMILNANSKMWQDYTPETVSGKTAFEYSEKDETAQKIVEWYIEYLAIGLANIANAFRPQVIMLGGGICNEGDRLIKPLQKEFDKMLFGGTEYAPVKIIKATLGNRAGALGAAALNM